MSMHAPDPVAAGLPRGRRIGIDAGDVRVGLAESDLDGMIATPVETLAREGAAARAAAHILEVDGACVYIGLPRSLSGGEGPAAQKARDFAAELEAALRTRGGAAGEEIPLRLIDERLTTVTAHQALHSSGRKGRRHRSVVDQVAAVMILQSALDAEKALGRRAGTPA